MFPYPMTPPSASNFATQNDAIFYTLCGLTLFFTVLVCFFIIFFCVRYKVGSKADRSRPVYEDLRLELTWTFIPLGMALVMFFFGAKLYVDMKTPPKDAEDIFVIGKQWMWHIEHRNGVRENNVLHVAIGKPVKLTMISQDVIHAFYIPAFRVQWMVVPGRYTSIWFTPTQIGEYHLFCNMYCGTQHSEMGGKVVVLSQADYARWLANSGETTVPMTMEQAGARIYHHVGCDNCHGDVDSPRAPSLLGIYNQAQKFADQPPHKADDASVREAILRPYDHLVAGYGPTMPAYQGQLSEADVIELTSFIKSMGSTTPPSLAGITTVREAVNNVSPTNTNNSIAVEALRARTEDPNVTPTVRKGDPAVNALAARQGKE
jgi:cytochrome c oxidase subunit 2